MFRFLWTTDLHLGFLHGKHPKPNIMLEDFDRICQYAISNNILHLIVTGDISDKSALPVDTTAAFISLLKKYNGRLHIYLMRGNHDYLHDSTTSIDLFVEIALGLGDSLQPALDLDILLTQFIDLLGSVNQTLTQ